MRVLASERVSRMADNHRVPDPADPSAPDDGLAKAYRDAVHAASKAGVSAEPEAQLTEPVAAILRSVAADAGLGHFAFLRETQLPSV